MALLKTLLNTGILAHDAQTLNDQFGDQPEADFLDGLENIARCLAFNESPNLVYFDVEPWGAIHQEMMNTGDFETAFQEALKAYDAQVQVAISGAVAVRKRELVDWKNQNQAASKRRKTTDYIKLLTFLGYHFRFNQCTQEIEVNGAAITDELAAEIRSKLRDANVGETGIVEDAYRVEAWHNRYHPIRQYLNGLTFDGGNPIEELAGYFMDEQDVFKVWLKRWLIGAVARVMAGEQNRVLVLDGKQGLGKDYFVKWLSSPTPTYYYEGAIMPDDKDCRIRRMWTWIWNVNEFGNTTRRADREALKAFITNQTIRERRPYGRYDTRGPAISSFIGTVNNEIGVLNDPTGSRRFMIAHMTEIDWNYARFIDVNQVWAQAIDLYLSGEPWELKEDEKIQAEEINETYQMVDIVEESILKLFRIEPGNKDIWTSTLDILTELKTKGDLKAGVEVDSRRIASALTKLGLEKPILKKIHGNAARGYYGIEVAVKMP